MIWCFELPLLKTCLRWQLQTYVIYCYATANCCKSDITWTEAIAMSEKVHICSENEWLDLSAHSDSHQYNPFTLPLASLTRSSQANICGFIMTKNYADSNLCIHRYNMSTHLSETGARIRMGLVLAPRQKRQRKTHQFKEKGYQGHCGNTII